MGVAPANSSKAGPDPAGRAAWVTVTVCPATVTVPVRAVVSGLAAKAKATVPLPLPEAPLVTVIQPVLLNAVQLQPCAVAVTPTVLVPAAASALMRSGATRKVHPTPAWVIVDSWLPQLMRTIRGSAVGLG